MFLRDFDYEIIYVPGAEIANADVLSRLPRTNIEGEEEGFEGKNRIAFIESAQCELMLQALQTETGLVQELVRVKSFLEKGRHPASLKAEMPEFVKRWSALRVSNGVICIADRAVVPRSLRDKVLKLLHLNHFGETKMKRLVRQLFWWPLMDENQTLCPSSRGLFHIGHGAESIWTSLKWAEGRRSSLQPTYCPAGQMQTRFLA